MANKIFTNGEEGKILTSVGNRIIKQPYEFGNAFQNRMGLNNYILISGLNLSLLNSSEIIWGYKIPSITNSYTTKKAGTNNYNNTLQGGNQTSHYQKNSISFNGNLIVPSTVGAINDTINCQCHSLGSTTGNVYSNSNSGASGSIAGITDTNFTDLLVGACCITQTSTLTPTSYTTQKISTYSLFSRQISFAEYLYHYNNKLCSDLQSIVGLEIFLKMDKAEVINISGVDQPCVRDYSGNNRHGIIMNLPAGTVQQKVDYANANLFVPFLS